MDRWSNYLHRSHTLAELAEWAQKLGHFRFCRAIGGHANDGDELVLALAYSDSTDLERLAQDLGVASLQPPVIKMRGIDVRVAVLPDRVLLSLAGASGDPYEVTSADVDNAKLAETILSPVLARKIDPPIDGMRCICPANYPQFWLE